MEQALGNGLSPGRKMQHLAGPQPGPVGRVRQSGYLQSQCARSEEPVSPHREPTRVLPLLLRSEHEGEPDGDPGRGRGILRPVTGGNSSRVRAATGGEGRKPILTRLESAAGLTIAAGAGAPSLVADRIS